MLVWRKTASTKRGAAKHAWGVRGPPSTRMSNSLVEACFRGGAASEPKDVEPSPFWSSNPGPKSAAWNHPFLLRRCNPRVNCLAKPIVVPIHLDTWLEQKRACNLRFPRPKGTSTANGIFKKSKSEFSFFLLVCLTRFVTVPHGGPSWPSEANVRLILTAQEGPRGFRTC